MRNYVIPQGHLSNAFILNWLSGEEISNFTKLSPTFSDVYPQPYFAVVGRRACREYTSYFIGLEPAVYLCFHTDGETSDVKLYAMGDDEFFKICSANDGEVSDDVSLTDIGMHKNEIADILRAIAAYDNINVPEFSDIYGFEDFSDVSKFKDQRRLVVDAMSEICKRIFLPLEPGKIHA